MTPTPVQQVCLVLSPRAAEAVRDAIYPARDAAELASCDSEANTHSSALLAHVIVEINEQLANNAVSYGGIATANEPLDVGAIAARMAEAGAQAVKDAA